MSNDRTAVFERHRRNLEAIAYRMLGTLGEARDVVQETYLKWHAADVGALEDPRAWLVTVCSRIALNELNSARKRRESYVGEWLPEPLPDDGVAAAEIDDDVSVALLVALEKLSPVERAVFILHDVFDRPFDEIAGVVGKSGANCRQLAARARRRIRDERPRFTTTPDEHRALVLGFMAAARDLDYEKLIGLLAADVEVHADGGGKAETLREVLCGAENTARFFVGLFERKSRSGVPLRLAARRFNGRLGILVFEAEQLVTALAVEVDSGAVVRLYAVRNPEKLAGLKAAASRSAD